MSKMVIRGPYGSARDKETFIHRVKVALGVQRKTNDTMEKAEFASRSEAGRYAAHVRWARERGVEPVPADVWRIAEQPKPPVAVKEDFVDPTDNYSEALGGRPFRPLLQIENDPEVQESLQRLKELKKTNTPESISASVQEEAVLATRIIELLGTIPESWKVYPKTYGDDGTVPTKDGVGYMLAELLSEAARISTFGTQWANDISESIHRETAANPTIFVNIDETGLELVLDEEQFLSQFATGGSGGLLSPNTRAAYEAAAMGIVTDCLPTKRPIYGSAMPRSYMTEPRDSERGKWSENSNSYGEIAVELKPSVLSRTTLAGLDSLGTVARTIPVKEVTAEKLRDHLGHGFSQRPSPVDIRGGYTEAQVLGGVTLSDIARIWVADEDSKESVESMLEDRDLDIPVEIRGDANLADLEKAKFASRSEAGRYAAHVRWSRERGIEPTPVDQWRAGQQTPTATGRSAEMQKIVDLRESVAARLAKLKILDGGDPSDFLGQLNTFSNPDGGNDMLLDEESFVAADVWDQTKIPAETPSQIHKAWLVDVDGWLVPNAEVMQLMFDVTELGSLINQEVQRRIDAKNSFVPGEYSVESERLKTAAQMDLPIDSFDTGLAAFVKTLNTAGGKPIGPDDPLFTQYRIVRMRDDAKEMASALGIDFKFDDLLATGNVERVVQNLMELRARAGEKWVELNEPVADSSRAIRLQVLKEIRDFGISEADAKSMFYTAEKKMAETLTRRVTEVLQELPTDWLKRIKATGKFRVEGIAETASSWSAANQVVRMSPYSTLGTAIHEMVHMYEDRTPSVKALISAFDYHRTTGNVKQRSERTTTVKNFADRLMSSSFEALTDELSLGYTRFEDDYLDPYAGRIYRTRFSAHEQVTTSTDHLLFPNRFRFNKIDVELAAFTMGIWAVL